MKLTILEPRFGSHEMSDALADMYQAVALKMPNRVEYSGDLESITETMLRESEAADILIFVGQMNGSGKARAAAARVFETSLVRSKKAIAHISHRCAELGLDPKDYMGCSVIPHGSMPVIGDGVIPACFCVSDERTVLLFDEIIDEKLLSRFGALCSAMIGEHIPKKPKEPDTPSVSFSAPEAAAPKPAAAKRTVTSHPKRKKRRSRSDFLKSKLSKRGAFIGCIAISAALLFALLFGLISSCQKDPDDEPTKVTASSEDEQQEEEEIEIVLYEKPDDEEPESSSEPPAEEPDPPASSEPESKPSSSSAAPAVSSSPPPQPSSAPQISASSAPSVSSTPEPSSSAAPQPSSQYPELQITTVPPPALRQPTSEQSVPVAPQQPDEQEEEIDIEVEMTYSENDEDEEDNNEVERYDGRLPKADRDAFDERLSYTTGGGVKKMNAYDLVCQILQNETRGLFEHEALKAHAVATYSMIKYNNERGTAPSVLLKKDVSQAVEDAVEDVLGVAVYYNGEYANTVYHSTSSGNTTSSESVWGGSIPYLESVKSKWDSKSPYYKTSYTSDPDKLAKSVKRVYGIDLDGDPADWFEIEHDAPGGYVGTVIIDGRTTAPGGTMRGKKITGRSFRENLLSYSIRSHCFDLEYDEDQDEFVITTYGYGHGVGMSQYGAQFMAQEGYNFVEILQHYYPGTDIE